MTGKAPFTGPAGMLPTAEGAVAFIPEADVATGGQSPEPATGAEVAAPVRVSIRDPFQVTHDRRTYRPGDSPTVPAAVAERWVRNRWAVVVELPADVEAEGRK